MPAAFPALTPLSLSSMTRVRRVLHPFRLRRGRGPAPVCRAPPFARYKAAYRNAAQARSEKAKRTPDRRRWTRRHNAGCAGFEHRLHPFNRAQRGKKRCANPRLQLGRKLLGDCVVPQRFIMLEDRRHASSKKQIECLIDAKIDAIGAKVSRRQRQLSTSLSTNTPSQSKMMRSGLIIAVSQFRSEHIPIHWAITLYLYRDRAGPPERGRCVPSPLPQDANRARGAIAVTPRES